jgi:hypothetical protein
MEMNITGDFSKAFYVKFADLTLDQIVGVIASPSDQVTQIAASLYQLGVLFVLIDQREQTDSIVRVR